MARHEGSTPVDKYYVIRILKRHSRWPYIHLKRGPLYIIQWTLLRIIRRVISTRCYYSLTSIRSLFCRVLAFISKSITCRALFFLSFILQKALKPNNTNNSTLLSILFEILTWGRVVQGPSETNTSLNIFIYECIVFTYGVVQGVNVLRQM